MFIHEISNWVGNMQLLLNMQMRENNLSFSDDFISSVDDCILIDGKPLSVIISEKRKSTNERTEIDPEKLIFEAVNPTAESGIRPSTVSMCIPKITWDGKIEVDLEQLPNAEKTKKLTEPEKKDQTVYLEKIKSMVTRQRSKQLEVSSHTQDYFSVPEINKIKEQLRSQGRDTKNTEKQITALAMIRRMQQLSQKEEPNYLEVLRTNELNRDDYDIDEKASESKKEVGIEIAEKIISGDSEYISKLIADVPNLVKMAFRDNEKKEAYTDFDFTELNNLFSDKASQLLEIRDIYDSLNELCGEQEIPTIPQDEYYITSKLVNESLKSCSDALRYTAGTSVNNDDVKGANRFASYQSSVQALKELKQRKQSGASLEGLLEKAETMAVEQTTMSFVPDKEEQIPESISVQTSDNEMKSPEESDLPVASVKEDELKSPEESDLPVASVKEESKTQDSLEALKSFATQVSKNRWDTFYVVGEKNISAYDVRTLKQNSSSLDLSKIAGDALEAAEKNINEPTVKNFIKEYFVKKEGEEYPRRYTFDEKTKKHKEGLPINYIPKEPSETTSFKVKRFFHKITGGLFFSQAVRTHNEGVKQHDEAKMLFDQYQQQYRKGRLQEDDAVYFDESQRQELEEKIQAEAMRREQEEKNNEEIRNEGKEQIDNKPGDRELRKQQKDKEQEERKKIIAAKDKVKKIIDPSITDEELSTALIYYGQIKKQLSDNPQIIEAQKQLSELTKEKALKTAEAGGKHGPSFDNIRRKYDEKISKINCDLIKTYANHIKIAEGINTDQYREIKETIEGTENDIKTEQDKKKRAEQIENNKKLIEKRDGMLKDAIDKKGSPLIQLQDGFNAKRAQIKLIGKIALGIKNGSIISYMDSRGKNHPVIADGKLLSDESVVTQSVVQNTKAQSAGPAL